VPRRRNRESFQKVWLGPSLRQRVTTLALFLGYRKVGQYCRDLILRGMDEDYRRNPTFHLTLRPDATVYRMAQQETYVPLANSVGGERVWVISTIPTLPPTLGGGNGYLCDVTSTSNGGLEGRGVVVRRDDVVGSC
jgi:hypothetical protein